MQENCEETSASHWLKKRNIDCLFQCMFDFVKQINLQDSAVGHLRATASASASAGASSNAAWGVAGTAVAAVGLAMSSRSAKAGALWLGEPK